jgi:energy-coupling factor transport system substrate-specific component
MELSFPHAPVKRRILVLAIAAAAGTGNALLGTVVHVTQIPLYLDSILTVIVALHFGLIPGIVTAVTTNSILAATGQVLFPFVCCNVLTAVITAGFRSSGLLGRHTGYLWLGLAVAVINGLLGSVLAFLIYSGVTTVHGIDRLVMGIMVTGRSLVTAVFWSGMLTNLVDKLLSALIALVSAERIRQLFDESVLASKGE